jgi:hypothetical protein
VAINHLSRLATCIYVIVCYAPSHRDGKRPLSWRLPKTPRASVGPSKYRPISLLSAVGKTVEAVLLHRLKEFVETHKALPEFQLEFRRGHSTTQQLLRFVEWTIRNFNFKKSTGVVFSMLKRPLTAYGTRVFLAQTTHIRYSVSPLQHTCVVSTGTHLSSESWGCAVAIPSTAQLVFRKALCSRPTLRAIHARYSTPCEPSHPRCTLC